MVADTLREFLENGNIRNCVNFPEAVLPRVPNTTRLAIANSNVPNMVGQISTCLAAAGLNIADLLNKSRGEYAYTLIDADGASDAADLLGRIRKIDGSAGGADRLSRRAAVTRWPKQRRLAVRRATKRAPRARTRGEPPRLICQRCARRSMPSMSSMHDAPQ